MDNVLEEVLPKFRKGDTVWYISKKNGKPIKCDAVILDRFYDHKKGQFRYLIVVYSSPTNTRITNILPWTIEKYEEVIILNKA